MSSDYLNHLIEIERLNNELLLKTAECDGLGSVLLDVQQDCVAKNLECKRLYNSLAEVIEYPDCLQIKTKSSILLRAIELLKKD